MNPRQALLDALTAERFTPHTRTTPPPVTKAQAERNTAVMLAELATNDRYDRQLRLIMGTEAS